MGVNLFIGSWIIDLVRHFEVFHYFCRLFCDQALTRTKNILDPFDRCLDWGLFKCSGRMSITASIYSVPRNREPNLLKYLYTTTDCAHDHGQIRWLLCD